MDREFYGPKKLYFARLLGVVSAFLCYLHILLLIYTLLEQGSNSDSFICTNNSNMKEKQIIKLHISYTSSFKNVKSYQAALITVSKVV